MVDFAGWEMPLHYGSLIEEHEAVRTGAGVFDVSHMTVVDVAGPDAAAYLRFLLANDVGRLEPAEALYSAMLNEKGGVMDDLIAYRLGESYRLVLNCATHDKDMHWLALHAARRPVECRERGDLVILAVHGPQSLNKVALALAALHIPAEEIAKARALLRFRAVPLDSWLFAHTGYTGEEGLEIMLPADRAPALWDALLAQGVPPVGLGARDTLRLEAGMNLYGHEMDEATSPLSANMGGSIAWDPPDRDFIGRPALEAQREAFARGELPSLAGVLLEGRGVLREGLKVHCAAGGGDGLITSGTFSPTLRRSIGLARLPAGAADCRVELRGKSLPLRVVKPRFIRSGRKVYE